MSPSLRTRRSFLRDLTLGVAAAPFVTRSLFAQAEGAKIRHATFGTNGMAWADVTAKFLGCAAAAGWPEDRAKQAADMVAGLESLPDVHDLTRLLTR